MICVLHHLYTTISAPDSIPDKRLYQLLCKLALMLCMPALIIVVHIIVQDRRYIFVQQAGCIPSISFSLFPLISVLIWPLFFNIASLAYLGLVIYSIWVPRRERRVTPPPPETMTLFRFLRIYLSLFIGVVCTSSVSLFLLVWIVNSPGIPVDSLHHDFQTVYILTTDQWSHNPQLRTAIQLRWLWASSSVALAIGLFPTERANQLLRWLASAKVYVLTRGQHRSISNTVSHGSLPVYISRTPSPPHSGAPVIPPLVRQSPLAPTLCSRASAVEDQRSETLPKTSERDTRSSLSQLCDNETIRPHAHSEPEEAPQHCDPLEPSRSSEQTERVPNSAVSTVTLADSTYPASSVGRTSSAYRTCEEESIRREPASP